MSKDIILTGDVAKAALSDILVHDIETEQGTKYPAHSGAKGYYFDETGVVVAFDNSTDDCWVEEFGTEKEAKDWLR